MCVTECQIFVEIDGKKYLKRYRFGEPLEGFSPPNKHFIELGYEDYGKDPHEIITRIFDENDVPYEKDWHDTVFIRMYQKWLKEQEGNDTRTLLARAKEVGAKVHHMWNPEKIKAAIDDREAELAT